MRLFGCSKFVRPVGLVVVGLLAGCATENPGGRTGAKWGEYGGKLEVLRAAYSPPQNPEESNHFIDLIAGSSVREFARAQGLLNNNALFVLSHGRGVMTAVGRRYAFLSGFKGEPPAENAVAFSPRDLARVLGRKKAGRIHNLVLAGCNSGNMLYPSELLQYFPAVTNIIHAEPQTDAYEATFCRVLTHHSSEIKDLFRGPEVNGVVRFGTTPKTAGARKLAPYVARLYKPGSNRPFAVQVAGRELLEPSRFPAPSPTPR
jgi:hypothetical protein